MNRRGASPKTKARVLIIDDHPIVRYGIFRILSNETDLMVCAESNGSDDILNLIVSAKPAVVVLDISLKGTDGLLLTRVIRAKHPKLPIVILSMHDEKMYGVKAMKHGANGYVMKDHSSEKLVAAIRTVMNGRLFFDEKVKERALKTAMHGNSESSMIDILSSRERQIFFLLGIGQTPKLIAARLGVSCKTVDTHRCRIKEKLSIRTAPQLMLAAAQWIRQEGLTPNTTPLYSAQSSS